MNLFEINNAIKIVKEKEDLDPETIADTLDSLEITRDEKLDGVSGWIESNKAKLDWIIKRRRILADAELALKHQNERLMDYLTKSIDDSNQKEIQTKHYLLKPRNYRASTIVEDTKKLPIDYVIREEVLKVDKKKIYEDLKTGKEVKGAYLRPNRKTIIQ